MNALQVMCRIYRFDMILSPSFLSHELIYMYDEQGNTLKEAIIKCTYIGMPKNVII